MVMGADPYNSPRQGFRFFMAAVEVTHMSGSTPRDPYFRFGDDHNTVGNSNASDTQYNPGCGDISRGLMFATDRFPRGAITGTICWSVRSSDAASFSRLLRVLQWTVLDGSELVAAPLRVQTSCVWLRSPFRLSALTRR
jgi:hypothetical protein